MKKIYLVLSAVVVSLASIAQTVVPGGDMENWRNTTAGAPVAVPVHAPLYWYGLDSLIIGVGEPFSLGLGVSYSDWHTQVFEENTVVHSGSHSAKLISIYENSAVGIIPGSISNSQTTVTIDFATMSISSFKYPGGTVVAQRPTSVSA